MFDYIQTGECFISDTTIGYPTCHLCSKFHVQFVISTVKSRQTSNIHTHGFLLKCKKHFILPTDQSKSPKKTINTLNWNYRIFKNGCRAGGLSEHPEPPLDPPLSVSIRYSDSVPEIFFLKMLF